MVVSTFNVLSICTGVGGLDLGFRLAVPQSRTVCYVEGELYAASNNAGRIQDKALDEAPIWSNVRTFDGKPWRGVVDCVIGGYPCQPFSKAGKRRSEDDERYLWPSIARIIGECRPTVCFFENVANHLRLGFKRVNDDLRRMGYRVASGLFTASEVGGPCKGERLFVIAQSVGKRVEGLLSGKNPGQSGPWGWRGKEDLQALADTPFESRGGRPQPILRRVDDGLANWVDRLRACGNGVVPAMAQYAWMELYGSMNAA